MILHNVVEESVRTACADFMSFEYYTTRQLVETKMYMQLMDNINRTDININLHLFQLRNIDFPSSYNNIISEKQSVIQMSQTEMNKRQSELILANTTYIQAVQTAKQLLIQADNQKQLTLFQANTTANIIQTDYEQRAISYEYIMTQLNLNATGMIDYLESEIIRTSGNMYVGL
jgi:regulator of protease activity HflC (stomatin/prohibitin superfamily)